MFAVGKKRHTKKRPSTDFGRRHRALRESAGLTQTELAERADIAHYQMVAKYERGENEPNWSTVVRLAEALSVEPNAFLAEDDDLPGGEKPGKKKPKRK